MAVNLAMKLIPDQQRDLLDDLGINMDDILEVNIVIYDLFTSPYSKRLDLAECKEILETFQEAKCRYRYSVKKHPLALAITSKIHCGGWMTSTLTLPFSEDKKFLLYPGQSKPIKCYRADGLHQLVAFIEN